MNQRQSSGDNGFVSGNLRHPSLDNLRRSQNNTRSYPQLPSDVSRSHSDFSEYLAGEDGTNNVWDLFFSVLTGAAAVVCTFGLLTLLTVLYITVRPFSLSLYRRLASQMGEAYFLDALSLLLPNTRILLSGDSDVPSPVGTSVLVCNHLMDADWWAMLMLGRCVGLRGSLKVFLRNEALQLTKRSQERSLTTTGSSDRSSSPSAENKTVSFTRSTSISGSMNTNETSDSRPPISPQISLCARLLRLFLDFPLLSGENNKEYISDRGDLFQLLRSFAGSDGNAVPVHLLLFPEGWSIHDHGSLDRKALLAKSNDFAKREGRPQLKHLLLPRTTGFNASLESLREASPVVYDVTMAYRGYNGKMPPSGRLSLPMLWMLLRREFPEEIHIRIKRFSMEEVLQDATWLDKQWAEKDRVLGHFSRHQSFPTDNRGYPRHRVFDTQRHAVEGSVLALGRLLLLPCAVPVLLLLSVPLLWTVFSLYVAFRSFKVLFPDERGVSGRSNDSSRNRTDASQSTPGSAGGVDSAAGTPFLPATPFVSPSVTNWRDMPGESPARR